MTTKTNESLVDEVRDFLVGIKLSTEESKELINLIESNYEARVLDAIDTVYIDVWS